MNNHSLEQAKTPLEQDLAVPNDLLFERLKAEGMIDDKGRVTGHIRRWDAFLAVTAVKYDSAHERILDFRCFKPACGIPGGATIDFRRESMVEYLHQKKRIITALWDKRLGMWKEGATVHLTAGGFIRTNPNDEPADNLENLQEFQTVDSGL